MNTTAIIRQRGQVTIPKDIRNIMPWTQENSVVSFTTTPDQKIIIGPAEKTKKVDWKRLRAQLKRVSKYKGKRGNLSEFIIRDRERH